MLTSKQGCTRHWVGLAAGAATGPAQRHGIVGAISSSVGSSVGTIDAVTVAAKGRERGGHHGTSF